MAVVFGGVAAGMDSLGREPGDAPPKEAIPLDRKRLKSLEALDEKRYFATIYSRFLEASPS